jgi:rod shape-determining protein MreD
MTLTYLQNIIRFVFLVLFQVLILNSIHLSGYVNPYFYIYFILLLPWETPKWLLLMLSFLLGLSIDIFSNTPGLNAAASVMAGFARPFVIRSFSSGNEFMIGVHPSLRGQGMKWFLYYAAVMVIIHHTTLFFLDVMRFSEFLPTMLRVILSSIFTLLIIFISEYLFYTRERI